MDSNNPNKIIIHHTGGSDANPLADSSNATAQEIDVWHKKRWPGFTSRYYTNDVGEYYHVGYHFVIEKNGKIVPCRLMTEEGAHTIGQNKSSVSVCLSGNFDLSKPTKPQQAAFKKVFKIITEKYPTIKATDIYPHRKYANKTCYGNNLSDTYFTELLKSNDEPRTIDELRATLVQLSTQLLALLTSKRYSTREIK